LNFNSQSENEKTLLEPNQYDEKSLKNLSIKNGDFITIESETNMHELFSLRPAGSIKTETASSGVYTNKLHKINIINCINNGNNVSTTDSSMTNFSTVEVNAEESELVSNIKLMAISALIGSNVDSQNCHLRYINENSENMDELRMFQLANDFSASLNLNKQGESSEPTQLLDHQTSKSFSLLGSCLFDDSALGELVNTGPKSSSDAFDEEHKFLFLLCAERAPLRSSNECVVKCYLENANNSMLVQLNNAKSVEIVVDLISTRVSELTDVIVRKMNLEPLGEETIKNGECYYLKKLDWLGDVEAVLNSVNQTCSEANLDHNQCLLISKGKLL
jgi:hypothetical protein